MYEELLENLLENKTRTSIAAFFSANPERSFYLGEIEKRLGSKTVLPHLNALVKNGMLKSFSKRGKKYFFVNSKNQIWEKLRNALPLSAKKYEDELLKNLKKMNNLRYAVLSGVFTASPHLECDLLLVGNISKAALDKFVYGTEKLIGQELNYALMDVEEFKFRKGIFDRFTKDIFENPHLVVVNKIR